MKILTYNMQGYDFKSSKLSLDLLLGVDLICIQRISNSSAVLLEQLLGRKINWSTSTDHSDLGLLTIGPAEVSVKQVDIVQNEYDNSQGKRYHKFVFNNYVMIHQYGCYDPVESKNLYFRRVLLEQADFIIGDTHRVRESDNYQGYNILNKLPTFMSQQYPVCIDWIMCKDSNVFVKDEYVPTIDLASKMHHYPVIVTV